MNFKGDKLTRGKLTGGKLTGGKLIGEGSSTCIFRPNLPCKNKKIDIDEKTISKLFLEKPEKLLKEIKFNEKISKLPKSKEWSITLYNHCEAPDYETIRKVEPDIDKCLKNNRQSKLENFDTLYGPYGGVSMDTAFNTLFVGESFKDEKIFIDKFKTFMKECNSLFLGLNVMYKNKIIHYDIKPGNITYTDNKYKYIDFGISTTFNNKKEIEERALNEFGTDRIYIYYSFDILYLYASKPKLYLEKYGKSRRNYDILKDIQEVIFDRNYDLIHDELLNLALNNGLNERQTIEKLDTYSLGITISKLLFDNIIKNLDYLNDGQLIYKIKEIVNYPSFIPFLNLLKRMTEPISTERISPVDAYKLYKKCMRSKKTIKK
tara:strand:+ start:1746 stop:2873 length:1128 start_codon:yes stop_codon:yes gene_type:complete